MNLTKLFETQRVLDERIVKEKGLEGQDLLPMKILALQVELGELANEWRGFKFWSEDREPRMLIRRICHSCDGKGEFNISENPNWIPEPCLYCEGTGLEENRNPLLEEYVDCLHFILSIGNYIGCQSFERLHRISLNSCITKKFNTVFKLVADLDPIFILMDSMDYELLFNEFIELGEKLGFTWNQVEQAYYAKNQINHERQEKGY